MLEELELVKELRNNTLEAILKEYSQPGDNLNEIKVSIVNIKIILYDEAKKIAERKLKESLNDW